MSLTVPTELPSRLWKTLTSAVGIISVRHGNRVNVMSAEWSYFVNKEPLYAAVVLSPKAVTRELLPDAGEFGLTLCSERQAELADFVGSFSVAQVDKTTSELVEFGTPRAITTPWVTGGVVALECVLRETVPFPVHTMFVGEVVACHLPDAELRPLVKHGPMHTLGGPVRRSAVVAAAAPLPNGAVRIAATGPAADGPDVWRLSLLLPDGAAVGLGEHPSGEFGDLLLDVPLPPGLPPRSAARIKVERQGAEPGYARIAPHQPDVEHPDLTTSARGHG
ncbi:flavin reductase family protein [Streptomyces silvisoli]|uniref:Flavin reductase family protein n=1 Tax=Streptomyces silvisoli TaxID=3034235 RepID=A0ABT5ZLL0_9ACTN|nr:flavin reductase family protein [Streptomyces silvisoli]MDF3290470.1 flavin reductase family protein [Streptomyces silvisoli]